MISRLITSLIEIYDNLKKWKRSNYSVKNCKAVEYDAKPFDIQPYLLGLWLGDGLSDDGRIVVGKQDVILLEYIKSMGHEVTPNKDPIIYGVTGLQARLEKMNLIKNKHIPEQYFFGNIGQRLELLQGLMDSDGYASKQGGYCQFSNNNINLVLGIKRIINSLGFKAHISSKIPKIYGKECKRSYQVTFKMDYPAFRLERKLANQDRKLKPRQL